MKHGEEAAVAILICCFLSFFQISISSTDTLTQNQTLRDGDTIVSQKQRFELGFFSPGNSNKNRYLGIWYKNIPDQTVVWVANRDYPISDSTGTLRITDDANLILRNQAANTIWSTNASKTQSPVVARLLDSGNLVIIQANQDDPEGQNDNYLWQSFDYPTDTLLPEMKLGADLRTGFNRVITAWKAHDDPGTGDYSFRLELQGLPEIFLMNRLDRRYRSGPWNGLGFSGVPEMKPNYIFNFSFFTGQDEIFYKFSLLNESIYSRLVVNYSGEIRRFTWLETTRSWSSFWYAPKDQCDEYRECGSYGICDANDSPVCNCVPGFAPRDEDAWNLRDGTGGCVLNKRFECGKDDGFLRLQGMKLPDTGKSFMNRSMSLDECKGTCKENCSCLAYSSADISNGAGGTGCVIWFDDLVDLREYSEGGQDLYVRVAASVLEGGGNSGSSSHTSRKKKPVAVIVTATIVPTVALLGLLVFFVWKKKLRNNSNNRRTEERGKREKSQDLMFDKVLSRSRDYSQEHNDDLELPLIDFTTLAAATKNFSNGSKLGQGGFGSVFKGILADGREIAVKRLSKNSGQGVEEFKNEVSLIAKLQHRNLVRLLGCCIEGEEKMLIYEYMQNKSLDFVLFNKVNCLLLDWRKRFNIIVGIARGLLYLHQDSRFRIIHRDLKASNILLDGEMNPKISDFGMARMFGGDETDEANTKRVVGTYGYMAPEYAMDGLFSIKSDVFSFGVLVLEIVSGKKNRGFYRSSNEHNLLGHAWRLWKEGKALELMDTTLSDSCVDYEVFRCIQVGLLCVQERAEERPTMSSVVLMLSSEAVAMAQPKQPGFCLVSSPFETESSSSKQDSCTVNHVTVTMLDAR